MWNASLFAVLMSSFKKSVICLKVFYLDCCSVMIALRMLLAYIRKIVGNQMGLQKKKKKDFQD